MPYYRVYFLDDADDKITDFIDADCEDDAQAIAMGREQSKGRRFDIWQEERWVGVFDPSGQAIKG